MRFPHPFHEYWPFALSIVLLLISKQAYGQVNQHHFRIYQPNTGKYVSWFNGQGGVTMDTGEVFCWYEPCTSASYQYLDSSKEGGFVFRAVSSEIVLADGTTSKVLKILVVSPSSLADWSLVSKYRQPPDGQAFGARGYPIVVQQSGEYYWGAHIAANGYATIGTVDSSSPTRFIDDDNDKVFPLGTYEQVSIQNGFQIVCLSGTLTNNPGITDPSGQEACISPQVDPPTSPPTSLPTSPPSIPLLPSISSIPSTALVPIFGICSPDGSLCVGPNSNGQDFGVSGRYVLLSGQNGGACLNVAELEVYDANHNNVALASGVQVLQSGYWDSLEFPAHNLIDGNVNNFAHTSCGHNGAPQPLALGGSSAAARFAPFEWMVVDLGSNIAITQVVVQNRRNCCQDRLGAGVKMMIFSDRQLGSPAFVSNPLTQDPTQTIQATACFGNPCNGAKSEFPGAVPPNQAYLFKAVASSENLVQLVVVSPPNRAGMWLQPWAGNSAALLLTKNPLDNNNNSIYNWNWGAVTGAVHGWLATLDSAPRAIADGTSTGIVTSTDVANASRWTAWCAVGFVLDPMLKNLCVPPSQVSLLKICSSDGALCVGPNSNGAATTCFGNPCNGPVWEFPGAVPPIQAYSFTAVASPGNLAQLVVVSPPERAGMWLQPWAGNPAALLLTKNPQDNNNNPIYNWNWGTVTGAVNGWLATLDSPPRAISGGTSTGLVTSTNVANATRWAAWCRVGFVLDPFLKNLCVPTSQVSLLKICSSNGTLCVGPNSNGAATACFGTPCNGPGWEFPGAVPPNQAYFFKAVASLGNRVQPVVVSPPERADMWLQPWTTNSAALLLTKNPQDNNNNPVYNWNWGTVAGAVNGWLATLDSTPRAISSGTSGGIVTSINVANATRWAAWCVLGTVSVPPFSKLCVSRDFFQVCDLNGLSCLGANTAATCFGGKCSRNDAQYPGQVATDQGAFQFSAVAFRGLDGMSLLQLVCVSPVQLAGWWLQQTVEQTSGGPISTVRLVNSGALTPLDYWTIAATSNNTVSPKNVLLTVDSTAQSKSLFIVGPATVTGSNNSTFIAMSSNSSNWQLGWQLKPVPPACKVGVVSERVPCYCEAGKYVNASTNICQLCPEGMICPKGFTFGFGGIAPVPQPCPPGTYPYLNIYCRDCPLGTYNANFLAHACTYCEVGKYTNSTGSSTCKDCMAGTYSNYTGASICTNCRPGTVNNQAAQSACQQCTPGTYSNVTRGTQCLDCQPGYAQNMTGQANCTVCKQGFFSNTTKQAYCSPCQPGYYGNETAATTCHACWLGSHNSWIGATTCYGCTGEWYADQPGQANCSRCLLPSWSISAYSVSCIPLPLSYAPSEAELQRALLNDYLESRNLMEYYTPGLDQAIQGTGTGTGNQLWTAPLSDVFAEIGVTQDNIDFTQPLDPQLTCFLENQSPSTDCGNGARAGAGAGAQGSQGHETQHHILNTNVNTDTPTHQHQKQQQSTRVHVHVFGNHTASLSLSRHSESELRVPVGLSPTNVFGVSCQRAFDLVAVGVPPALPALPANHELRVTHYRFVGNVQSAMFPIVPRPGPFPPAGPGAGPPAANDWRAVPAVTRCQQRGAQGYAPDPYGNSLSSAFPASAPVGPPPAATLDWVADLSIQLSAPTIPAGGSPGILENYQFIISLVQLPAETTVQTVDIQHTIIHRPAHDVFSNVPVNAGLLMGQIAPVEFRVRCHSPAPANVPQQFRVVLQELVSGASVTGTATQCSAAAAAGSIEELQSTINIPGAPAPGAPPAPPPPPIPASSAGANYRFVVLRADAGAGAPVWVPASAAATVAVTIEAPVVPPPPPARPVRPPTVYATGAGGSTYPVVKLSASELRVMDLVMLSPVVMDYDIPPGAGILPAPAPNHGFSFFESHRATIPGDATTDRHQHTAAKWWLQHLPPQGPDTNFGTNIATTYDLWEDMRLAQVRYWYNPILPPFDAALAARSGVAANSGFTAAYALLTYRLKKARTIYGPFQETPPTGNVLHDIEDMGKKSLDMLVNALLSEWQDRNVVCLVEYPFLGPRQNRDLNAYSKKRYYDNRLVTASSGEVEYVFAMQPISENLNGPAGGYPQVKPLFMIEAKRPGDFNTQMQGQVLVEGYLATVQHHIVDHLDDLITDQQHTQFTGTCVMATDSIRVIFYRVVRDTIQGELVTWRSRIYNINNAQDLLLILSIAHSCIASRWLGVYPGLEHGVDFGGPAPDDAATPAQVRQWNDQRPPDDPNRLSGSAIPLPQDGLVDDYIIAHAQELATADRFY